MAVITLSCFSPFWGGGGRGERGGEGGEVGVEEEDSSIPMAQRHLTDNICVPSRDGEYQ